ncbi:DMT family transporter [Afifella sp. IM 167]|uniref:DMT family transporter n=1 Tax=Afifella sp. IM 167 TaxID=2033586 RepID=UPI001CC995E8|nr:DMT family transporter [Afifella sp. IM 167]MBZ8134573.1 EamA family transporter [Afifella sp. IM 167]
MAASRQTGIIFAFLCLGILGAMPILANQRPESSDDLGFAIWLTFWQILAGLPLFLIELRRGKRASSALWRLPFRAFLIALLTGAMFGIATYMYVVAARKAGAVSMAIALQAYPIFAIVMEAVFQGKRKTATEIAFTLVLLAALFYLTTEGTFRIAEISWWSAFALGIPLLWASAHMLLRGVLTTLPVTPNQVTVSRLILSGICLLLLQAAFGEPGALGEALVDLKVQRAAIVLGLAYYLELLLWFHAMRHIDVSVASSVTVPAPAVTMLITVLILGGRVEIWQIAAMTVIVLAMYGLLLAGRSRPAIGAQ